MKEYVDQPVDAPLTLTVYPGANGAYSLYEDDGKSFDYRKGAWVRIDVTWRDSDRRLTLSLARTQASGPRVAGLPPATRRPIEVRLAGSRDVKRIVFEGKALEVRL